MKPLRTWYNNTTHKKLELYYDENPENPRTEWDNTTTMVGWRSFDIVEQSLAYHFLGDFEDLKEFLEDKLYLFIARFGDGIQAKHKDYSIEMAEYYDTNGVIFISKKDFEEQYPNCEDVYQMLRNEVGLMDKYLNGNVYLCKLYEYNKTTATYCGFYLDEWEEILEHAELENPEQWSDSNEAKLEYENFHIELHENAVESAKRYMAGDYPTLYKLHPKLNDATTVIEYFLNYC
jgi:hypothetical protein